MLRIIQKEWRIEGVLTDATTAKLSDPTGTYGLKRNDTGAVVVVDGTAMTKTATGTYQYSFTPVEGVPYTAYVEIVYGGATYHFEVDIAAYVSSGAITASYSSLLERVGHFLFGIRTGFTADQTSDIGDCIRDGLRDVYSAHSWSFFRPIKRITTDAPYSTGTITVASGLVTLAGGTFPAWAASGTLLVDNEYYEVDTRDGNTQVTLEDTTVNAVAGSTYELSRAEYDLPSEFESIEGALAYEPGRWEYYPAAEFRHDDAILKMRQDDNYSDRPLYFSVRTVEFDPAVGSRRRIVFYPTPDEAYVLTARMNLRPVPIDDSNQYPIGGEMLAQVILEACLAAAERNFDEGNGVHTKRFMELLPDAIRADKEASSPTTLGPDGADNGSGQAMFGSRIGDVTFNGTVM